MFTFIKYIKLLNFKILFFISVFFISFLYFIPNIYKEDPSVIVFHNDILFKKETDSILKLLNDCNLRIQNSKFTDEKFLITFFSFEDQLLSKKYIEDYFKDKNLKYDVSLNVSSSIPYWLNFFNSNPIKLGLDLKGGVRFLMEVDFDYVIIKNVESYYNNVRYLFKKNGISYLNSSCSNNFFEIKFNSYENMNLANMYLKNNFSELMIDMNNKNNSILLSLTDIKINDIKNSVINQSLYSFRKRIDELGLSESNIRRYGDKNIMIELPGLQNIDRAKNILGKIATVNFFMLDENHVYNTVNKYIPIGSKLLYDRKSNPILLKKKLILSGDFIESAYHSLNDEKKQCVNVKLTKIGAKNFFNFTSENVGKYIAVVYCETFNDLNKSKTLNTKEEIVSIGKIMQPLYDNFQITGLTLEESKDLALILRAGVLPTNIFIVEEKIVGPSLGKDNVVKGYHAIIFGLISVLFFMFLYYEIFGLIANICLILNLIFLVSCMSALGAVLTLPGIAGIVLILGMSIDSNVLIFERIRERILLNDDLLTSIDNGYKHSFVTIIDSNLTTFFVGVLLFVIGDGPIKGFAITLCIGIITSLYSSIVGTRIIIDIFFKKNIKHLPIGL